MEKTFNPTDVEKKWYAYWEKKHCFEASGKGEPYCIMIPPPNVTGTLHMGHGFQYTLMDILIRYHRMSGFNTLWQVGTDHAGISTQMVVERQLAAQDISRHDLGREKFTDKIWAWKEKSGSTITKQMRTLGVSVDWQRERFTMDEGLSEAVTKVFVELYDQKIIYRGKRLVNWDPKLRTAISNLEVINEEKPGKLYHIHYPIKDSSERLTVATTRPETLFGDTAIAVNPKDARYTHLIGQSILLPLTNRTIPIVADEHVDRDFGTGCVKITPAHDFNDYEVGKRHNLPLINILTPDAHLNENVPDKYQGMERFAARKATVIDLEAAGLLEKTEAHTHKVPLGDRSGVVIEPYLTDQWYVDTQQLKGPAIDALKNGALSFVPEGWQKTYLQWLENIEDWCISRQLWWGHQIPAWYDAQNTIYVGENEAAVRKKYQLDNTITLTQDEDVLDTWFSSALWPFSTLGWPENTKELETFYPTSTLVTGFDIIFFWVIRMVMMGLKFTGKVPFKAVYITGLIRDHDGKKMSKSKGNVIDPLDLIYGITLDPLIEKRTHAMMQPKMKKAAEKATRKEFPDGIPAFGTDAVRFTFCAMASTGRNIRFDLQRTEGYRNFCNKLWNASRFVLMNCAEKKTNTPGFAFSLADHWISARLQATIATAHEHLKQYRFDLLAQTLYDFVWNEYCDWYVEAAKVVLYDEKSSAQQINAAIHTLIFALESILKLLHPIIPFITEEIWQSVKTEMHLAGSTIMLEAFPTVKATLLNPESEIQFAWLQSIVTQIRTIRAEMRIAPNKKIPVFIKESNKTLLACIEENNALIAALTKAESITLTHTAIEQAATAVVDHTELFIPMAGIINKDEEMQRLSKEIARLENEIKRSEGKLNNPNYADKAPEAVVKKEKEKLTDNQAACQKLQTQLATIKAI